MATYLVGSGTISLNDINTLFARGTSLSNYLGTTYYTSTTGPLTFSSGAISFSNFYGTGPLGNRVTASYTFSANTQNATLAMSAISGYVAGSTDVTITVNSGVYLWSSAVGTAGLALTGGSTGDTITLVNNGYIMGQGGNAYPAVEAGGTALSLGFATTINNTNASAYIGGGGGGGGGIVSAAFGNGGGGAGGGNSGAASGGAIGASGGNGVLAGNSSGAGGRIFSGLGGAYNAINTVSGWGSGGGSGGGASASSGIAVGSSAGGGGGGWGASGGRGFSYTSTVTTQAGGGGGFANAAGTNATSSIISATYSGGAGGKAVALNGFTVTFTSGNTTRIYGAVA